jgi:hypothetical protein
MPDKDYTNHGDESIESASSARSASRRAVLSTMATTGAIVGSAGVSAGATCDYAFRAVYGPDVDDSSVQSRTIDAVESLKNQINNKTGKNAISLDPVQTWESAADYGSECDWFEAVADSLDGRMDVSVRNNDIILAGHKKWTWGHGAQCSADTPSGDNVPGGVHYVGTFTNYRIAKNIGIQELGHWGPFWANHHHGAVDTDSNGNVTSVSPMITSYVIDENSYCDTEVCANGCGGGSTPDYTCWNLDNGSFNYFDCPVHDDSISYCFESIIEDDSGNYSDRCS